MPRQVSRGGEALSSADRRQPVWDLPIRLFHWLLAALIGFSWWSVKYHHTDWHLYSGFAILTLLLFRLLWGVVGSSTARFTSFVRGPAAIRDYLRGRWTGIGHSPLAALSVLAMLAAVAVQVGLGLIAEDEDGIYAGPLANLVSVDTSDQARHLHEALFNVILGLIILHVAAVIFYQLRGRKLIAPMITGRANSEGDRASMRPGKWWIALLCLAVALGITRWIVAGVPPFSS
jgi:cytochrome b